MTTKHEDLIQVETIDTIVMRHSGYVLKGKYKILMTDNAMEIHSMPQ
jgi:hypothetical protein